MLKQLYEFSCCTIVLFKVIPLRLLLHGISPTKQWAPVCWTIFLRHSKSKTMFSIVQFWLMLLPTEKHNIPKLELNWKCEKN